MSQNLAERLRMARKQAGLTQKTLAEKIGASQTAVHKLESGACKSSRKLVSLALACEVDPIWLATGKGEMLHPAGPSNTEEGLPSLSPYSRVPLLSWEDAYAYCQAEEEKEMEDLNLTVQAWIPVAPKASSRSFGLQVLDDCMAPEFSEGDLIVVDPGKPGEHNQFVVVWVEGQTNLTFSQLSIAGGRKYLKPMNARYPLVEVQEGLNMGGVVVCKYRDY